MSRALDHDPQQIAANPAISAFVTANAGSGKTKTLIDRVARLLLARVDPEKVLCVTYTKAAAAEMQRRLFSRLGDWSVMGDEALTRELVKLEGPLSLDGPGDFDARRLSEARALFARALETPGGLKIQTIHAFCEKLLRRFPLEAGVSPGFRVMDDAAAAAIADAARKAVARFALKGDNAVAEAYARFSVALDFAAFQSMFLGFETRRAPLAAFFAEQGGYDGAAAWVWNACGADPGKDPEILEAEAMADLDRGLWRAAAEVLRDGGTNDQKAAAKLAAVAADPNATLAQALDALFTEKGDGTPVAWVAKTSGLKSREDLRQALSDEQDRLAIVRERMRGARVAADTLDALVLAEAYLAAYRIEKTSAGALDFADLIEKTKALLASRPAAAWVLFKLDGGIDHILVDEAQDTAPDQWDIVRALTGEFFVGAGVDGRPRPLDRTLFVVGDDKQSIYSFQGADPARLHLETEQYIAQITGADRQGRRVPLNASWRSTVEILDYVDAVFNAGVPPGIEALEHIAMREGQRGCVDLWPLEREVKGEERDAWTAPLDEEAEGSATKRLARNIACEIEALVSRGDRVSAPPGKDGDGWRPAKFGDVLILVRKRGALFEEVLRALKRAKIPVAGADRLALSEHIVFDDLLALARFALFPADDLTLAALLRSPFCDVEDESLYRLAKGRETSLWRALLVRADEAPEWRGAADFLSALQAQASELRPFELYGRVLGMRDAQGRSMRQRLLRRLGHEAEDALDEFLAQVLAAESRGVHDLESLAAAFASLDITVKRELEAGRDEVRVMTAHGAKGLEAPIVFLPETTTTVGARGSPLMATEATPEQSGGFLWSTSAKGDCEASREAREFRATKENEESLRLLYVALTRARERLVLCGRIASNRKEETLKGWWAQIRAGFDHADIEGDLRQVACGEVIATRYGPDPRTMSGAAGARPLVSPVPAWAGEMAKADLLGRYASPSDLDEGVRAPSPSPLSAVGGLGRFRRGDLIHRLLQILPDLAPDAWAAGAQALLARERDLTDAQRAEMTAAALSVLRDDRFAEVFGPGSRAEVAIAGSAKALPEGLKISGRIDRLVLLPGRVLVADFKSNRPSPARIEDADPAYLRQMAIYAAVLAEVFPDRRVEAALVWTDGPKLMPVPENLLVKALADLRR
jgi:ATP-dependent helicase/nuclease subunit A